MKYVITGATSFIGQELTALLLQQGHEVVAVCRPTSPARREVPAAARIVDAELFEYKHLHQQVAQADVFIHLAWAGTSHAERHNPDIHRKNIDYTLEAMQSAKQMGCRLFVEAGSQAEYGICNTIITEESPCHPVTEYGKAKLAVKEAGFELSEKLGIKYLHLRIFSIYGEKDHPQTLIMSALDKLLRNEPLALSSCTQNWNFLYIQDAVVQISRLCQYALDKENFDHEVFHIASAHSERLKGFVERLHVLSQSRSELHYGAITPVQTVSLLPDISKTQEAIGIVKEKSFDDIINHIIHLKKYSEEPQ